MAFPFLLSLAVAAQAQELKKDTVIVKSDDSAVFLNAASDSKPREISLGLPMNSLGVVPIFEDGMPASYYIYHLFPYKSWHGGVSASKTGTMGPMETAMRYGEINYFVDSYNKTGSDKFKGALNYTFGHLGQHKIDANITGPLGDGWAYSLSTYQNFDKGPNHMTMNTWMDRHQFYKGVVSKKLGNRGEASLVYQYVDFMTITENVGPFVFVGDGSVQEYNGFNLGHDTYLPSNRDVTFMDVRTGKMETEEIPDGSHDRTHHVTFNLNYQFDNGMKLDFHSRVKTGTSLRSSQTVAGIDEISAKSGYAYADGHDFSGLLQRRSFMDFDCFERSWLNTAMLTGQKNSHKWLLGADLWFNHAGSAVSSATTSHEVKANPERIYKNGQAFYSFNVASEWYDGYENTFALFARDEWKVNPRLDLKGFFRIAYLHMSGDALNNVGDDTSNTRYDGFNMTKAKITPFGENDLNGAFGLEGNYRLTKGLTALAEYTFTRTHNMLFNYGAAAVPGNKPSDTQLVRAGLSYQNDWINVVSQVVYINQNNKVGRSTFQHQLTKPVGDLPAGFTETVSQPIDYGIASWGWTTDAMITPNKHFSLNLAFTLRNPLYKNFIFKPTFSDGVTEEYDFSDKNVTSLHKMELTVSPSYNIGGWRFWLTGRYISKQFINKTNSLFFGGRLETFGGIDYRINKTVKLNMNVINILNQKGASGLISSADLVVDASGYKNYVMAGTFIRPFTVEIGATIDF